MKTSIYSFLTVKWLEEDADGVKSVFMDKQNKANYEAMVKTWVVILCTTRKFWKNFIQLYEPKARIL